MLIPIGHDRGATLRTPWVTIVLAAISILVFLDQRFEVRVNSGIAVSNYEKAISYLIEHPWLEPPEALEFGPEAERFLAELRRNRSSQGLARFREREQARLVELTSAWEQRVEQLPFFRYGYRAESFEARRLITSQFIHADWMHLIGNMVLLLILGPPLEDVLGRLVFPILVVSGGAFAALFHGALTVTPGIPLGGFSGALAAVMGMFFVRFAGSKLRFLLVLIPFYFGRVQIRAWIFLLVWVLIELGYASIYEVDSTLTSGVAHLAHFGGFTIGVVVMFLLGLFGVESRWLRPRIYDAAGVVDAESVVGVDLVNLTDGGVSQTDLRALERQARSNPTDIDSWIRLWDVAIPSVDERRLGGIARAMANPLLANLQRSPSLPLLDLLRDMLDRCGEGSLTASARVRLADALERVPSQFEHDAHPLAKRLMTSSIGDFGLLNVSEGVCLARWCSRRDSAGAALLAQRLMDKNSMSEMEAAMLAELSSSNSGDEGR